METKTFSVELDVDPAGKLFIEGVATRIGNKFSITIEFAEYTGGPQIKNLLDSYGNKRKINSKVVKMFGDKAA